MKFDKNKEEFVFNKANYAFLLIGLAINVIGFLLMIGGADTDLNEFNENGLFSKTRLTVAPILILIGYGVIIYSIMMKPKKTEDKK